MRVFEREPYILRNTYANFQQDVAVLLSKGEVRNDAKHKETCAKNRRKRKKRK